MNPSAMVIGADLAKLSTFPTSVPAPHRFDGLRVAWRMGMRELRGWGVKRERWVVVYVSRSARASAKRKLNGFHPAHTAAAADAAWLVALR